jgi:HEAT repeat protein
MLSFLPAGFLLGVVVAGPALAAGLLLVAAAARILRGVRSRRRARAEQAVRPMVLAVASGADIPPELVSVRGGLGRAAERIVFGYLTLVRGEAATSLADVLDRRGAVARTLRRTHSPRAHRRAQAATRLGLIASPEAERRLAELVTSDQNPEVRIVATRALGKTGSAAAARTLLHSLSRPAPVAEGIVASALLELGPEAVPGLRAELAGGRRQRAMAANVLGLLDELPAWQGLVENAAAGSVEVRVSAVRALGRLGLPQVIGPVTACLQPGEDPVLRAAAAHALGRIGDPQSARPLAACLKDQHYWVAHNAAMALAELGEAGLAELTLAAAGHGSAAAHAREALARRALARGERPAAPAPAVATARPAPAGQAPAGKALAGRAAAGRESAGQAAAGQAAAGQAPAGAASAGQAMAGRESAGQAAAGQAPARQTAGQAAAGQAAGQAAAGPAVAGEAGRAARPARHGSR